MCYHLEGLEDLMEFLKDIYLFSLIFRYFLFNLWCRLFTFPNKKSRLISILPQSMNTLPDNLIIKFKLDIYIPSLPFIIAYNLKDGVFYNRLNFMLEAETPVTGLLYFHFYCIAHCIRTYYIQWENLFLSLEIFWELIYCFDYFL